MSTHARPLAVWLSAADDTDLERLFAARGVRSDAAWHDFFDAAEALLEPASVEHALHILTREEAQALLDAASGHPGAVLPRPVSLALVRPDGTLPPPVADVVAGRTVPPEALSAEVEPSADSDAALAAEHAFTNVAALGDLLLATRDAPFALLAGGMVNAAERRRMTDAGLPVDRIDALLALAADAGLTRVDGRLLRLTRTGDAWLRLSAADRWSALATAFRAALPAGVRSGDGGWLPPESWQARHPWDPAWPVRSAELVRRAGLLGLVDESGREPAWATPLREGRPADVEPLRRMLPAEVDRIFLQNDLSAIAPGPLAPALDVRLRTMAERESAAQASSYRFTADSLTRALADGETEESITAFLAELSLTGIPQPLRYLISQTAARHGLVRISADAAAGRTRVSSTDAHLIDTLSVDQALRPLGLLRDGDALTTRVGAETTYWALTDAHYPATIVGADGAPIAVERHVLDDPEPEEAPSYAPLLARLRAQQGPDADAAWLDRELEAAVRHRAVVVVEVGMPDGSTRELTLEASGLGGGRLRGRDRAADVERTLPVSSIRSARVIDPSPT